MHQYDGAGPEPLKRWLADRPNPDNPLLEASQAVARRLLEDPDMGRAWVELNRCGIGGLDLRAKVENAMRNAAYEVNAQTPGEIATQLDGVERLIHKLREAIEKSPLRANSGIPILLEHGDLSPVMLTFGWHAMSPSVDWLSQPFSVVEALEVALEMLSRHRSSEPARAVLRQKESPEIRSFVINLGWLICKEFGTYLPGTIARIANAVYEPITPMDKEAVKTILKASPEPYQRFKKGGAKAPNGGP